MNTVGVGYTYAVTGNIRWEGEGVIEFGGIKTANGVFECGDPTGEDGKLFNQDVISVTCTAKDGTITPVPRGDIETLDREGDVILVVTSQGTVSYPVHPVRKSRLTISARAALTQLCKFPQSNLKGLNLIPDSPYLEIIEDTTEESCAKQCEEKPECVGFSMRIPGSGQSDDGFCYFLSTIKDWKMNETIVSSMKHCPLALK